MAPRAPRPPAPPATPPLDLRVMNAAASLLFAVAAIALLGLLLGWVTRSPRFTIERIHIEGDFEIGRAHV